MKGSYFIFFILLIASCIDPVTLQVGTKDNLLVVDGMITDLDEPQSIRISRSQTFDNTRIPPAYLIPEIGAEVKIHDNDQVISLAETLPGLYVSPASFKGVSGHIYKVEIMTNDGSHYISRNEIMPNNTPIESLPFEYTIYERLIKNASGKFVSTRGFGFNLSIKINDPPGVRNYYRWKVSGIFEFFSISDNPDIIHCYAPHFRLENKVLVKDDGYVNGSSFTEPLAIIPYDRATLYLATVQQQSLTQNAFEFWNNISQQQLNTGGIFDQVPTSILGNVYNTNNEDEEVLGYFYASSISTQSVLINRFLESGRVSPSPHIAPIPGDCLTQVQNATRIKPPGFP